jgi:hypothetical protein
MPHASGQYRCFLHWDFTAAASPHRDVDFTYSEPAFASKKMTMA